MPPRKTSRPPPYAVRNSRSSLKALFARDRLRFLAVILFGCIGIIYLFGRLFSSESSEVIPAGTPLVVIVTAINKSWDPAFVEKIKKNRQDYAARHGYTTFFPNTADYNLKDSPLSWSKVPAMRHAMTLYPSSTYFWYLDPTALIMNRSLSLTGHIVDKARLESLMIVNKPVVPPDSVIKTFDHVKGDRIDLVVAQDRDGLCQSSFIIRRGEWAKYFLDAWFDPLYRSYNFQKAEGHALEHIVQWHGTILAKLALIPQRTFNSYTHNPLGTDIAGMYSEGDFVANFIGCDRNKRSCADEMQPFFDLLEDKGPGKSND